MYCLEAEEDPESEAASVDADAESPPPREKSDGGAQKEGTRRQERRRQHVPKGVSVEVKELPAGLVLVLVIFDQLHNMGNKIYIFVRPTLQHFWVLVAFPVIGSCCIGVAAQKGGEEILQTVGA